MKANLNLALAAIAIIFLTAFSSPSSTGLDVSYGVSADDPSQIELTLNKDHSFTYQDFSVSSKKIKVEGTYKLKNKKLSLEANDGQKGFHRKWKISEDGMTAKSRKGLCCYTLGKK